jgi:hypothetical protein
MKRYQAIKHGVFASAAVCCLLIFSKPCLAVEFMSLKEAIKHFLPEGSSPYKVTKTIPDDKYAALKKKYHLKDTPDFKDTLKKGPYTIFLAKDANKKPAMYIMILEQYWRTCYHKFAVGVTPDGAVKEIVVVELNCKYAYPINKKSFLKQFKGKKAPGGKAVKIEVGKDIDAVSGATRSSELTAIIIRRALALHEIFFSS